MSAVAYANSPTVHLNGHHQQIIIENNNNKQGETTIDSSNLSSNNLDENDLYQIGGDLSFGWHCRCTDYFVFSLICYLFRAITCEACKVKIDFDE